MMVLGKVVIGWVWHLVSQIWDMVDGTVRRNTNNVRENCINTIADIIGVVLIGRRVAEGYRSRTIPFRV